MRILLDYRPALRVRSGVGEYVHQLAKALAHARVDRAPERRAGDRRAGQNADTVEVFTSSWKDRPDPNALADLGEAVRVSDRRLPVRLLNLAWHRVGWPPVEWLTGHRYDVVHTPYPLLLPSNGAARLCSIHDLDFLDHPERTSGEVRRDYPGLVRLHAHLADGIMVPSKHIGSLVEQRLEVEPGVISVCPLGVPAWEERPRPLEAESRSRSGYILFLSTLHPRKNVGGLLEAYGRLVDRVPSLPPLVLAGGLTEEARPWLESLNRPPLAGRVEYRGYVRDEARQSLYEGARLLVLPSFDEGFGLPVVEAMSLGVPVVAADRGSLPEVVGDAALLVNPDDPESIAHAMEELLSSDALASTLVTKGKLRALQFTWARAAEITRGAYERAIDRRAARGHATR